MRRVFGCIGPFGGWMAMDALAALAAAGGVAVVQAAGSDAWQSVRRSAARLLARGDGQREADELAALDVMARELTQSSASGQRERWVSHWSAALCGALGELEPQERERVVDALRSGGAASVESPAAVRAGRDVTVSSRGGLVTGANVSVEGGIHMNGPLASPAPGPLEVD